MQQAFLGPLRLKERLGTLEPATRRERRPRAALPREAGDPPLPRLDGGAGTRARGDRRGGRTTATRPVSGRRPTDGADLRRRISALPGFGEMKVKALGSVLAKRFDVPVAQDLVPGHPTLGDVDSAQALADYQAAKKAHKARVAGVEVRTLTDGGQPAEQTAHALAEFFAAAKQTLEIAVYDFRLPPDLVEIVCGALVEAQKRGVAVRLAYNLDHAKDVPVPPPPITNPEAMEAHPFPTAAIPGVPDLMHHKYVVRDAACVWTGSTNWTGDSWTREENVIVTVDSPAVAARYREDFEQLWTTRDVARSGKVDTAPVDGMRVWFCPGRGEKLAHRIAKAIGARPAPRADRLAGDQLRSDPRDARAGRLRRQGRPRRRRRRDPDRRGPRSSGTRTGTPSGRHRCCARRSPARPSPARSRLRTPRARCTTTCTRR